MACNLRKMKNSDIGDIRAAADGADATDKSNAEVSGCDKKSGSAADAPCAEARKDEADNAKPGTEVSARRCLKLEGKAESDEDTVLRKADSLTAKDVMDAARFGDAFALKLLKDFARRLGRGLSFISCVTDPDIFVIGGGVSKAGDILVDAVREHFQEFVFSGQKQTKFGLATLGNDAGIYGCAKMIMDTAR